MIKFVKTSQKCINYGHFCFRHPLDLEGSERYRNRQGKRKHGRENRRRCRVQRRQQKRRLQRQVPTEESESWLRYHIQYILEGTWRTRTFFIGLHVFQMWSYGVIFKDPNKSPILLSFYILSQLFLHFIINSFYVTSFV